MKPASYKDDPNYAVGWAAAMRHLAADVKPFRYFRIGIGGVVHVFTEPRVPEDPIFDAGELG